MLLLLNALISRVSGIVMAEEEPTSATSAEPEEPETEKNGRIIEQLNRVPCFTLAAANGELFCAKDKQDNKFVLWHTDADTAKNVLVAARAQGVQGARLQTESTGCPCPSRTDA